MPQAMEQIRRELGMEAVIISSHKIRQSGLKGFFLPKVIEVTAAIEDTHTIQKAAELIEHQYLKQEMIELKALVQQSFGKTAESDLLGKWREVLLELEINKYIIEDLLQGIATGKLDKPLPDESWFTELMHTKIAGMLTPDRKSTFPNRIMCFVGPTGVGKTTTLAKLAAQFAFFQQKKVGLVTLDTYRIGAVDQLKTYGEIIGIPVEVAMTPKDLKKVIAKFEEKDLILIDTMGHPTQNKVRLYELKTILDTIQPVENYLVLSCATKSRDLVKIAGDYQLLNYTNLIFTKIDETNTLGSILNVVQTTKLPVAYITNGQKVPEDIEPATPEKLARLILGKVS